MLRVDFRRETPYKLYIHIVSKKISGHSCDKYYVGITKQDKVNNRWKNGKGYKGNKHFWRAIEKYGWENIEHQVIVSNLTKQEATNFEKIMIKELKANNFHYGYNITSGGEGQTGMFGSKNSNYGNYWSNKQKKKMSDYKKAHPTIISNEGRKAKSKFMKAKWEDPQYRNKMTGTNAPCYGRTGDKHPLYGIPSVMSKKVICLNTNELFSSATMASKIKNVNLSKLCMNCRGERKSCGKNENNNSLHWEYYNDYLKKNNTTEEQVKHKFIFVA